jgi:hypothetical protein
MTLPIIVFILNIGFIFGKINLANCVFLGVRKLKLKRGKNLRIKYKKFDKTIGWVETR